MKVSFWQEWKVYEVSDMQLEAEAVGARAGVNSWGQLAP